LRLREAIGPVVLVDARQGGALVEEIAKAGLSLDEGMVLRINGKPYHGDSCHRLALLTTPSGAFNRLNAMIFDLLGRLGSCIRCCEVVGI
jgi:hypothetical protein